MENFNLEHFINKHVVQRAYNMVGTDVKNHLEKISNTVQGKSILVIGGAGTIGSSFIKSILPFHPKSITVVDHNENGLTELVRDLRSTHNLAIPDFITYPVDFGSRLFDKIMEAAHFDIIASFAAHKHVRSEKDVIAVEAMLQNNVFNTYRLLELAAQHQPDRVFAVSTDKASNPVNVMGGSKKIMENIILAYADQLHVTTARFANVAFSNGSLLDGFIYRMALGQPLSAPSDVKRYFVTPAESGDICMLAALLGESSDIFFPKLDATQMTTFSEIADRYLHALGLKPELCNSEEEAKEKAARRSANDTTYPVFYFGSDTTGEKAFEEFYTGDEQLDLNTYAALGVVKNSIRPSRTEINSQLAELKQLLERKGIQKQDIVHLMRQIIPRFDHQETGKNLDSKM